MYTEREYDSRSVFGKPILVEAADVRFSWIGRTVLGPRGLEMAYPGIELRFAYSGPAPTLRMNASSDTCYFNLSVNGWPGAVLRLESGPNHVLLPSGTAPESGWEVSLVKRVETWQGIVTFEGLSLLEDTQIRRSSVALNRRITVIGDSITTGHYVEQMPGFGDPTPRTNNAERTWGWILARNLAAEVNIVAYGGRGLIRSWDGSTDVANAPAFFERALPDHPESIWDHNRYQPDVIVAMLGQNDFSINIPEKQEFLVVYRKFVLRLRDVHPHAAVLLCGSPMHEAKAGSIGVQKRATLYQWLDQMAEEFAESGFRRIQVVRISYQPGTGLNAHPVAFQQEQIAAEIEPVVRRLTGWDAECAAPKHHTRDGNGPRR